MFVGIDGFRRGWVAVWVDRNGQQGFDYSPSLERLLIYPHDRAIIDIPIGLPEHGYRICDQDAQHLLGSSVFRGARRNFWNFHTQDDANSTYHAIGEPGLSAQLWSIRLKIKEVDELMTPQRQTTLQESHPELVFWHLNRRTDLLNKKTDDGRVQRISILKKNGFYRIDEWLAHRWGTGIGRDDLIDACACALAAREATSRIPHGAPPIDSKGLRMEMWFKE